LQLRDRSHDMMRPRDCDRRWRGGVADGAGALLLPSLTAIISRREREHALCL
jgi:hypothetical protein